MGKLFSKKTKSDLTKLGIYQIIGGVVGLLFILWIIFKNPLLTGITLLVYLFILLFFGYSIFCGTLCLKAKKNALGHSLANQMLQVFGLAMMGFAFKYVAGIYLTVGLDFTDSIKLSFGAGISKFDFNFNNEKDRIKVDFNLVAFALIYWIDKLIKKVKEEDVNRVASSIGHI